MIDIDQINAEGTSLRMHQQKMLEILNYVDDICRKHNIDYWLSGGTLLGAVRHQGFIPWDDDLDIVLLKKDLKRLHQILKEDTFSPFQLQANDTDYNYVAPYEKVRMSRTQIKENNENDLYYLFKGIYIDLFFWEPALKPLHRISNKLQRLIMRMTRMEEGHGKGKKRMIRSYFFCLKNMIYPLLSSLSCLFNPRKISYPLGSFFNTQFDKCWIYPLREIEFEGRMFKVPNNYDAVLKAQYGNYMQLPPLDQISFHTCSVNFEL